MKIKKNENKKDVKKSVFQIALNSVLSTSVGIFSVASKGAGYLKSVYIRIWKLPCSIFFFMIPFAIFT